MATQSNPSSGSGRPLRLTSGQLTRSQGVGWLLMGLLLGLIIGWVVWPVQWTDADLEDLRPDVRAHFISATADAYVASGGQDPNTALARMQPFSDPQAAVMEAIAFFEQSDDSRRAIRVVNLRSLASALGAPSLAVPASGPASGPVAMSSQATAPAMGWLNWLLAVLAGLLLLGGGLWIGRRLVAERRNRSTPPANSAQPASSQTAWVPPPSPTTASTPPTPPAQPAQPTPPAQPADTSGSWQPSAPPDRSVQHPTGLPVAVETWDSLSEAPVFSEQDDHTAGQSASPPGPVFDEPDIPDEIRRIPPTGRGVSSVQNEADDLPADMDGFLDFAESESEAAAEDDSWEDDSWEDDSWEIVEPPVARRIRPPVDDEDEGNGADAIWSDREENYPERAATDVDAPLDSDASGSWPGAAEPAEEEFAPNQTDAENAVQAEAQTDTEAGPDEEEAEEDSGFLPTVQDVLKSWRRSDSESGSTTIHGGQEVGTFTAEYNAGILAYEQSFTITSTGGEDGDALGACGMAISESLDKSAANSNNVHVLDVWLYDGTDVRSASQYLVSPGMDKEALAEQAKSAGTITGEPLDIVPGLTFRIGAKSLLLECRILRAEFLTPGVQPGPLRTVWVEMKALAVE